MKLVLPWLSWILFACMALYTGGQLDDSWRWNRWATQLLKDSPTPNPPEVRSCSQQWLVGVAAGKRGDQEEQRQIWMQSLACSPRYLSILRTADPKDQAMAQLAAQLYPRNALAWFWLGEIFFDTERLSGLDAYLHVVELEPHFGLAWCRLGWTYESMTEYETASQAFYNCCRNGDPGRNGCFGAGRMEENLGNTTQAIAYYRLSRFENAQMRADELEKQLNP
jgi:tetratricopeptide (TPR) repeat protein